jgi:hypothetical protein
MPEAYGATDMGKLLADEKRRLLRRSRVLLLGASVFTIVLAVDGIVMINMRDEVLARVVVAMLLLIGVATSVQWCLYFLSISSMRHIALLGKLIDTAHERVGDNHASGEERSQNVAVNDHGIADE